MTASANGRRPRSPALRLVIELGEALEPLARPPSSAALARAIEADVEGAMRSLGLAGHAQVELQPGETTRPLRLRVNGGVQPYPPALARRAWIAVAPPELRARAAVTKQASPSFPSAWLADYAKELDDSDTKGWSLVAAVVRRLTLAVVLERPSRLLGDSQVRAYARATSLPPRAVAPALRRLLDLGVSVHDRDVVAEVVGEGEEMNRPREDTVEAAFAQLRSHAAELRVHPSTLGELLEGSPPEKPLSVHAPSLPEHVRASFCELEQMFFIQFGFQLPELKWVPTPSIPEGMLSVKLEEWTGLPIPLVLKGQLIVDAQPEGLPEPSLGTAVHLVTGAARAIVDASAERRLEDAGYVTWRPMEWVVVSVFSEAAAHADQLFGLEDVEYQLARLKYQLIRLDNGDHVVVEGTYPALVDTVLARYSLGDMTRVLRAMIAEGLSIHNLPSILERLLEYDTVSSDPAAVVLDDRLPVLPGTFDGWQATYASLRRGLRSSISHRFTRAENTVVAYLLEPKLEARLATGIQRTHGVPAQPLPEDEAEAFRDAVWQELGHGGHVPAGGQVILTTEGVRASVRRLLEAEIPDLPVLSYAELRPDVNVQPIARIPVE